MTARPYNWKRHRGDFVGIHPVVDWPAFGDPASDWSAYLAWLPIRTWDGRWRWLCWVERRRIIGHDYLTPPIGDWWQYRTRQP